MDENESSTRKKTNEIIQGGNCGERSQNLQGRKILCTRKKELEEKREAKRFGSGRGTQKKTNEEG